MITQNGQMALRLLLLIVVSLLGASTLNAAERPNLLWLSTEDMSPNLGCYGDKQAHTPHIDELAAEGIRYANAFVPCPVCATCRSSIITGVYSAALGTHHMRSKVKIPGEILCFPQYLRQAGYYCTNNEKEDYNFKTPPLSWDESSLDATWQNRSTKEAPFFAVFNFVGTHESSIRGDEPKYSQTIAKLPPETLQDPAKLKLPPFYPDTPKVREHWARGYNVVSALDLWVAERLAELDEAGVAEDTIVFFWSDHGAGIPRHKRWLYDTGTHVPLIVYVPEKWRHLVPCIPGEVRDQLVSLVDLGPTVLNLAGVKIPAYMQGQPFLGPNLPAPREYVHGTRDRMDESYDMCRSVRDGRYKYIRNYMPQRPYAQSNSYGDNSDIMREWRRLDAEGKLNAEQARFMRDSKPAEELFDTKNDPYELNNLADDPKFAATREKMSDELDAWMLSIRDLGVVPEAMLERAAPRNGTRYGLFRNAEGERHYASFADAAKRGEDPPNLAPIVATREFEARGERDLDDAIRVIRAERTLSDADADAAARDSALATLLDVYGHGQSKWDQIAAANVLDLHVTDGPRAEELGRVNQRVKSKVSNVKGKGKGKGKANNQGPEFNSLQPWLNRFSKRFPAPEAKAAAR